MTKDQIRAVFLAHGFTVKQGQPDLKPYVFAAAEALLAAEREACAQVCEATMDKAEQDKADQRARDAEARGDMDDQLARLQHWSVVSTFNAGLRNAAKAIRARGAEQAAATAAQPRKPAANDDWRVDAVEAELLGWLDDTNGNEREWARAIVGRIDGWAVEGGGPDLPEPELRAAVRSAIEAFEDVLDKIPLTDSTPMSVPTAANARDAMQVLRSALAAATAAQQSDLAQQIMGLTVDTSRDLSSHSLRGAYLLGYADAKKAAAALAGAKATGAGHD